ncbi:MAG: hypothetical protein ABGY75_06535, partial [Gemmataceae bacterium]
DLILNVKKLDREVGSNVVSGVVEDIDADALTLLGKHGDDKVRPFRYVPTDLLRDGKVVPGVFGCYAYRWQDVKKGDTVTLRVLKDDGDQQTYCLMICINRRPGGPLPESQNPKEDHRYAGARIFNAIENGEDVSEQDIFEAFPPIAKKNSYEPGGLVGGHYHWRQKLDANRKRIAEEKEKGLKAKSADGKSDPKKDDKK